MIYVSNYNQFGSSTLDLAFCQWERCANIFSFQPFTLKLNQTNLCRTASTWLESYHSLIFAKYCKKKKKVKHFRTAICSEWFLEQVLTACPYWWGGGEEEGGSVGLCVRGKQCWKGMSWGWRPWPVPAALFHAPCMRYSNSFLYLFSTLAVGVLCWCR